MSIQRIRTDFRFAIVMLFAAIAVLGISPFAVYRFVQGQEIAGAVDSVIVLAICLGAAHAWRGGNLETTTLAVMAALAAGCLAAMELVGLPGIFWMYPMMVGSFLVVSRGRALTVVLCTIGVAALRGVAFADHLQAFVFVATALVTSLFASIFAQRAESQREQLETLAARDVLTGAFNRLTMSRELQSAIDAAAAGGGPVALALMDLDHFKRVNDIAGHEDGDRVLMEFVALVHALARSGDRFFRSGGEEFVLLAPGTGTGAASLAGLAERLRADVEASLRCGGEAVTVSVGVAVLRSGEDARGWLQRADAAMYRAKAGGRNRVEVDPD